MTPMTYLKCGILIAILASSNVWTWNHARTHYEMLMAEQAAADSQRVNDVLKHSLEKQANTERVTHEIQIQYMELQERNSALAADLANSLRRYAAATSGSHAVPAFPIPTVVNYGEAPSTGGTGQTEELVGLAQSAVDACLHDSTALSAAQDWITRQQAVQ